MTVIDAWPIVFCSRCGSACMTCGTPILGGSSSGAGGGTTVRPTSPQIWHCLLPDLLGILPETSLHDR
jgi:hypothetical protein